MDKLIRLTQTHQFKPFDCADADLNDFLYNGAKAYQEQLLAVTYLIEDSDSTIAFFSLLNDKISVKEIEETCDPSISNRARQRFWNAARDKLSPKKTLRSYPAMKIGRLAVDKSQKGKGIGTELLDYLKIWFVTDNKTGCRYITVDAYRNSLNFYLKNGFQYLTDSDESQDTRLMYIDLLPYSIMPEDEN